MKKPNEQKSVSRKKSIDQNSMTFQGTNRCIEKVNNIGKEEFEEDLCMDIRMKHQPLPSDRSENNDG
jgi:hypothetical protein